MKKIKFLPSVLMLILSIAVLGLGVYAANPSTNTVTGSIKVNASAYPIAIRCLLDGEEIENHQTIRAGITWTDGLSNLEFNTDTALTVEDVDDRVITLEVTNLSNINLGAYFLTDDDTLTAENKATLDSISTVEHLVSGTDTVVKATKTGYQKLEPNVPVEMTVTMSLYQIFYEELDPVGFSFVLNVEECQDSLLPLSQGINVNTNGLDVSLTPSVNHGYTVETGMVTEASAGRYSTTTLAIDDDNYPNSDISGYKRYRTTNVKLTIQNNEEYGITADINAVLDETNIKVTTLDNAYIGAKEIGEVSLQFTPLREGTETVTATISDVLSNVEIYRATNEMIAEADVYSRVKYNSTNKGPLKHYIEYGVNPTTSEKLKWYICGVKVGDADLRRFSNGDLDENNKPIKSTAESPREYYFISETQVTLIYSNEGGYNNGDGKVAAKYEGSLLQGYLSGTTMRTKNNNGISTGTAANLCEFYELTNDPVYNQINARLLSELYSSDDQASNGGSFNTSYNNMADKFWALSKSEASTFIGEGNEDAELQAIGWTRSPSADTYVWILGLSFSDTYATQENTFCPAFRLEI